MLVLLLFAGMVEALLIEDVALPGAGPQVYGDAVVFERAGNVVLYDGSRREETILGAGKNPHIFGFSVAFESEGKVKVFGRERSLLYEADGTSPFVYSDFVVFSTSERALGIDFSNDGDLDDAVIRQLDLKTGEVQNLKAVGDNPVIGPRRIAFVTREGDVGVDLNADGDLSDRVIRILDRESRQVSNTKVVGEQLALGKSGILAFVSGGNIAFMDVRTEETNVTDIKGVRPAIYDDVIVFSRDGKSYGYSVKSGNFAQIGVEGTSPVIFGRDLIFVSDEEKTGDLNGDGKREAVIRIARDEDADGDDVSDFVDNCPLRGGTGEDADGDGRGDDCVKKAVADMVALGVNVTQGEGNASQESVGLARSGIAWYWYVLGIALALAASPYVWRFAVRYYRKQKKSFGF